MDTTAKEGWPNAMRDANLNSFAIGSCSLGLKLTSTTLVVNWTTMSTDKRLKFIEHPLSNALDDINKSEPVEYDQTINLVEQ